MKTGFLISIVLCVFVVNVEICSTSYQKSKPFFMDNTKFTARLPSKPSSNVTVYFYGATVTSWMVCNREHILLSKKSVMDGTQAIRGGIPVVFPQFGAVKGSKMPSHGFARISIWKMTNYTEANNEISITLRLTPNEVNASTRTLFNYKFTLEYDIKLNEKTLSTGLRVSNLDQKEFSFTWLLHTYIRVPALDKMQVVGLDGQKYQDKTRNLTTFTQRGPLVVREEVDRIFANVPMSKTLSVNVNGKSLVSISRCSKQGSPLVGFTDVVTWNPWAVKAKTMTDLADEYSQMIAVEAGNVATPVVIKPGQVLRGGQILTAMDPK